MDQELNLKLMNLNSVNGNITEEGGRKDIEYLVVSKETVGNHFLLKLLSEMLQHLFQ